MIVTKPDALVLDMDGTLWDAVDTYTLCCNKAFEEMGVSTVLRREELLKLMGTPIDEIMRVITPGMTSEDREKFVARVHEIEARELPVRGGRLFDGVKVGIERLSRVDIRFYFIWRYLSAKRREYAVASAEISIEEPCIYRRY